MTAPRPDDPTPGAARGEDSGQRWPQVSLIVLADDPVQAARTLDGLLQDPYPGEFEILLAAPEQPGGRLVGEGGDAPAEAPPADPVDRLATRDPRVAVIHSRGVSQAGLVNAAAFAASYPILSPVRNTPGSWAERVVKAVAAMEVTGADVVGGAQVAVGLGSAESAIARAMNSRLAPGPTRSRSADLEGAVDSVRV
ncbi:MAG: hypothetical protein LBD97_04965, partial [Bifidobacteriaceae bacterium]|nr:hypothetical protein [Bifidobacteriaceae bacterium]